MRDHVLDVSLELPTVRGTLGASGEILWHACPQLIIIDRGHYYYSIVYSALQPLQAASVLRKISRQLSIYSTLFARGNTWRPLAAVNVKVVGNESALMQLTQSWFPGQAIFNAKL